MQGIKMILVALILATAPSVAGAESSGSVLFSDRHFLELLGALEGPDGYDDITMFATRNPPKPITSMTINEVLDYQRLLRRTGARSSAMGRYQFIYDTLLYLTNIHDINRNRLFDSHMQDRLTRLEMIRCGFYESTTPIGTLGNCLARVWAALPLLTGPNRGKSRYERMSINSAQTSPGVIEAVLRQRTGMIGQFVRHHVMPGFNTSDGSFSNYTVVRSVHVGQTGQTGPSRQAGWNSTNDSDINFEIKSDVMPIPDPIISTRSGS